MLLILCPLFEEGLIYLFIYIRPVWLTSAKDSTFNSCSKCVCQVKGECNVWDLALLSLQLDATCQHMIFQSASDVSSWFSNTHVRRLLSIIWGSCKVLVQSLLCNRIAGFDSLFHAGDANTDAMRIGFPLSDGFLFPAALKTDRLCEKGLWCSGWMFWKIILFRGLFSTMKIFWTCLFFSQVRRKGLIYQTFEILSSYNYSFFSLFFFLTIIMLVPNLMTFFLLCKTKEDILNNVLTGHSVKLGVWFEIF